MRPSGYSRLLSKLYQWRNDTPAAVFFVDLIRFRALNKSASPAVADGLLERVETAMRRWAGADGISGRLWSDEFVAVRPIDHPQEVIDLAKDLRAKLTELGYKSQAGTSHVSVVIGVACSKPRFDWVSLIDHAGEACEDAKRRGPNQIFVYGSGTGGRATVSAGLEQVAEFRRLRDGNQLSLHPQPIMAISGRSPPRIAKAEFLLRVERNGSFVPPPQGMIESLEQNGVCTELDQYSCRWLLDWLDNRAHGLDSLDCISINLSAPSFIDGIFMSRLFDDIRHARLPSGKLCFEITETAAIQNLSVAAELISDFKTLGVRFSLDDFGSGLCSFGYLQALMVDEVKIDGRFIRDLADSRVTEEIVRAIHQVARATNKTTVAEFVDDSRKLKVLQDIGFDYAQGWLFYPSLHPDAFLALLHRQVAA